MKRFIIILLSVSLLLFTSCGPGKRTVDTEKSTSMKMLIDTTFTMHQFDSLCVADTISPDYKNWLVMAFLDYETNNVIYEYIYIKHINEDEIMYRLIVDDKEYKIIKRLTDN